MRERVARLRDESYRTEPSLSTSRAEIVTRFYRSNEGKHGAPMMRALALREICEHQPIHIGEGELIVGERGPAPKAVPTYPEITCHSVEDLRTLSRRPQTRYRVNDRAISVYESEIIPYWRGRTQRDRIFGDVPEEWRAAYEAGLFTEFMEQRAPGHTALAGDVYRIGLLDRKREIAEVRATLDPGTDPVDAARDDQLAAMDVACDAVIRFAERHAELADAMAGETPSPGRREELERIAAVCRHVPARVPRDLHEAIQTYWFLHLGTILELNGWDAMSPGRLDVHLGPFYERDLARGVLDRDDAKELLELLWIKFNNQPAPPKVGVTARESGTYNDFVNVNLAGLTRDGRDASNAVSEILLEVIDEVRLLQPQCNVQVARVTPDAFLKKAARLIRKGYGYPSVFNADQVVAEQVRAGKTPEDAREGGTSGCIETGCFGKEAYLLTGYLNVPKALELALHDGVDPATGVRIGPATGEPGGFDSFDQLYEAFARQLRHVVDVKIETNLRIQSLFARDLPAPFLSTLIRDCIANGRDYYSGGARYNTTYIQCCGIGTITDSLSAIRTHVYEQGRVTMDRLLESLRADFRDDEPLRRRLLERTPKFGNDDDLADDLMRRVFETLFEAVDGRPDGRDGRYHLNMLSTTCHVYFGTRLGATPDGRPARAPISDGTSPAHGADRRGPTAVCRSLGKMDQTRTGGTLLNQRFLPSLLAGEKGLDALVGLVRGYFRLGGHHIQFNVVDTPTLLRARERPEEYRDLLVRVAGYSDYFCDVGPDLQAEIIARTEQSE